MVSMELTSSRAGVGTPGWRTTRSEIPQHPILILWQVPGVLSRGGKGENSFLSVELREACCLSWGCPGVRAAAQSPFLILNYFSYFLGPVLYQ